MDNDKLLREISATLGTLAGKIDTALAGDRPPCKVPCATGHCTDNTAGICTGPETCARGYIKPLAAPVAHGPRTAGPGGPLVSDTPCLSVCYNCNCSYHGVNSNSCMAWAICVDHMPEDFKEAAAEDQSDGPDACEAFCHNGKCEFLDNEEQTCLALEPCDDRIYPADVPVEELLQGRTLAQWDEICKGGYLCQFAPDDHFHPGQTRLEHLNSDTPVTMGGIFYSEYGGVWSQCRPAPIPGVLRPWFGGDCPVDPEAVVLIKMRDGAAEVVKGASYIIWGHNGDMAAESEIIAYMEV